jgi:solute carrier family 25 (adenine nucleotide translocator) protein 4/5/6/31
MIQNQGIKVQVNLPFTHQHQNLTFGESFILSGTVACITKTTSAPVERVKLLLQNQHELIRNGTITSEFTGIKDCVAKTFKNEGTISFWRGNLATVLRYFPYQALNFSLKDQIKGVVGVSNKATKKESFTKNILAGGCAGSLSLSVVQSMDYTRTRLAMDALNSSKNQTRQFNGIIDCYVKTIKSDGIKGLYRGFLTSCAGVFIYRGLYFGLYDSLKPIILLHDKYSPMLLPRFLLGWAVTVFSELAAYPIDTVRRRMMMSSGKAEKERYSGSIDCFRQIVKKEGGPKALYRGAGVCVIKGAFGAGLLAGFDQIKNIYITCRLGNNYL